jgi:endonuclease/exonuclease/phosphatase family metal-dependent hydrolase
VCEQQFIAVRDGLAAAGWAREPGTSAFHPTMGGVPTVCGGGPVGIAVLSALPLGDVWAAELPHDGSRERRALLCAGRQDTPHLRFCSTHVTTLSTVLPSGRPANVEQLRSLLDRVEASAAAGNTVIVAGDLNAQPQYRRLDTWYAPRQGGGDDHGSYRELDDADPGNCVGYGEWTATGPAGAPPPCGNGAPCTPGDTRGCAKIDHLFVRQDRIAGAYSADALDIPLTCTGLAPSAERPDGACSDHRPLVGTVTVLVRP